MKAKKKFGQNFLNNEDIIKRIVSLFNFEENDLVIEIGPGKGALTSKLAKINVNTLCIEIDTDMHLYLDKYESDKLHVLYKDILQVDLNEIIDINKYNHIFFIGNLPYYITSPIMEHLINSNINFAKMVFMVQKEVADRYASAPGSKDYGYMTVYLNHFYDVKEEIYVSRTNFNPIPNVDSAVISLSSKQVIKVNNVVDYFNFVKILFAQKRKNIHNNLKMFDMIKAQCILNKYNLSLKNRAEDLDEKIIVELYESIGMKNE